jgi:hypothetical protein
MILCLVRREMLSLPEPSKPWFAAKRIGYGSGLPIAWQGWLVLGVYLAVVLVAPFVLPLLAQLVTILIATALLVGICARKTQGGWRWRDGS